LEKHNLSVTKYQETEKALLERAKAEFEEFCETVEAISKNLNDEIKSQYPNISRYTYLRTAFIRARNEMDVFGADQRMLYIYTDFVEDPAQKQFLWPNSSWKGIKVIKFRIPVKPNVSSSGLIESEILGWIKDNGGEVKSELMGFEL
jgi:hypothetical protein